MARKRRRPPATTQVHLEPIQTRCRGCGGPLWVAYHGHRTVTTLEGVVRLTVPVRRCVARACPQYHRPYRPEEELGWALPHGEFGLDVIALVGTLRYAEHRSVPEIHRQLEARGLVVAERTVTHLVHRYEELVAVHLGEGTRLRDVLAAQQAVVLAIDGLQPDVGHEVLWVLRDCLSGEILLARSLLSGRAAELVELLREAQAALPVPIRGVVSDGQPSIRNAVQTALPGVPHQLCHFHYLREAAKPIYEADRHAKKELKKQVRGIRPIERALEAREAAEGPDGEAAAIRGYCLAVRSALTDDGRPPLAAAGLTLRERLAAIQASITRVAVEKGACRTTWPNSRTC